MVNKFSYQQVLNNGDKIGYYKGNSPGLIAKKIAREIYINEGWNTKKTFDILFVKNRVKDQGGDIQYKYNCSVELLKDPIEHKIGLNVFKEYYKISVKNSNRK